jgi:eukaryotic-like serine/threonine-protein kinase
VSAPSQVGERYRLDRRLGAGGMATVFLALDTVLERQVALKLLAEHLAEDADFVARFRREALAAARLAHPNIVQVYDSGHDESSGRHFIVMEFVDGPSGADLLRDRGALEIEEAVDIVRGACNGLDYAHRAGVVHRDVKPGNLLVASDSETVKLADFGIARAAEQTRITQVGSVLGTAAYLSPEQARGEESGPPSDIYSIGVCAYQFLTDRLPYEYGSLTELALKQQNESVEPIRSFRGEVPEALDRAILICLEQDPGMRYGSARELAEALGAGLGGQMTDATQRLGDDATRALTADRTQALPSTGRASPAPRPPPRTPQRRKGPGALTWLAIVLAVLLAGAAVAIAASQGSRDRAEPVRENNVPDFVDGMKDIIQRNS